MCDATCSESGQLLTIKPCGWYLKLQSDRDRLAGVVQGMEEQSKRNAKSLHWHNQRLVEVMQDNARLREALDKLSSRANRITSNFRHNRQSGPADFVRLYESQLEAESIVGNALKEVG
jgi:hypothetical protein